MVDATNPLKITRPILSWSLYDFANSAFATTVMAGFFPLFFKGYWSQELSPTDSTLYLGILTSITSLILAVTSPAIGTLGDRKPVKKQLLLIFTILGAGATLLLFFVQQGQWVQALLLYGVAIIGFASALTFYDSLLVHVCTPAQLHKVSGLGYSLGYLGGGVLFAINVLAYTKPNLFGLDSGIEAVKWSFVSVAVWWLVFTLPLMAYVREPQVTGELSETGILRDLRVLFMNLVSNKKILFFLIGYLFFIDGVNTTVRMAVDYGMALGLQPQDLIAALLLVQFIGFPSALVFGWIGQKFNPFIGIYFCLFVYSGVAVAAYFLTSSTQFYFLACAIGLVQGGIQSLSRSVFANLIPKEKSSEYFGVFNMVGKFSAIIGPLLVGIVGQLTGNPRLGILVLLLFFLTGGFFTVLVTRSHKRPL